MGGIGINTKKCKDCGVTIDQKYEFCSDCFKKNSSEQNAGVINTLQQLNNNLYAIRTILEEIISKQYNEKLVWEKQKKRFEIILFKQENAARSGE